MGSEPAAPFRIGAVSRTANAAAAPHTSNPDADHVSTMRIAFGQHKDVGVKIVANRATA